MRRGICIHLTLWTISLYVQLFVPAPPGPPLWLMTSE